MFSGGGGGLLLAALTASSAAAETYYLKFSSRAAPPKCFTVYSDENCKTTVSITPAANDGNIYVVSGTTGSPKVTGSYSAPAATNWVFGTDGVAVGTKAARPSFNTNAGISLDFGTCTIYGINACLNDNGTLTWKGTNRLVKSSQNITFSGVNMSSGNRGVDLAGTFVSDTDVSIEFARTGSKDGYYAPHKMSGDFSNFRGGISLSAGGAAAQLNTLTLTSESAFGDPSVERTNYLTVGNFTRWTIEDGVTQYATKGITLDLADGGTSAMYAVDGASWTLTAPVTTKSGVGTLEKTGAGTVTLEGKIDVPSVDVKEGTLVIDSAATFEQQTTLTIRSGATVVTRQGNAIPNVTIVKEDGAVLSLDFTVPYVDGVTTALDYSALTEAEWAGMDKPLPVKLSAEIAHPVNAELRLPVIKLPSSVGATAADFSDTTGKTYGLPVTSFEVASDGSGCDVVYLVVRPVVYLSAVSDTVGHNIYLLDATQTDSVGAECPTWSDGLAAHEGADYVVANGSKGVTTAGWTGDWTFPGESISFVNGLFATKAPRNTFKRIVFYGGTEISLQGYAWGDCTHVFNGEFRVDTGTVSVNLGSSTSGKNALREVIDIAGSLTGDGTLAFVGNPNGLNARISGDGSAFNGKIENKATGSKSAPALIESPDWNRALAKRDTVDNFAIRASTSWSGFHFSEDCAFASNGFGLSLGTTSAAISVADGKTVTMEGTLVLASSLTCKLGGGTLALKGQTLYGSVAAPTPESITPTAIECYLHLYGGWVKPVAWNDGKAYSRIRFKAVADGAGLSFDADPADEKVKKYGMRLVYDNSIVFETNETKLSLKIDLPETQPLLNGHRKVTSRMTMPVLTVTDACAATIKDRLKVVKSFRGGGATITSAATADLEGYTTFFVTLEPQGGFFTIR